MNRLILVGNGFDLAHGLKTSYGNFIDDFWETQIAEINGFIDRSFENIHFSINHVQSNFGKDYPIIKYENLQNFINSTNRKIKFKNKFIERISNKKTAQNWVDIENEYYRLLSECSESEYSVSRLNDDFNIIKNFFIKYLNDKVDKRIELNHNIKDNSYQRIYFKDFEENSQKSILKQLMEILSSDLNTNNLSLEIRRLYERITECKTQIEKEEIIIRDIDNLRNDQSFDFFKLYPAKTLFLNFNYTNTVRYYSYRYEDKTINIHGELENKINPIIFGFGDDVDEKYKEFENLNDNRYLENFKSIAYLQTDNYKNLLEFINSEEYQVFIFGHSCGISDRTMLNTIFEHDNCKSIKPFYHKKEDGSDNYTELVQNISRNFNNKKKFRDRVVNKTYCEPLT